MSAGINIIYCLEKLEYIIFSTECKVLKINNMWICETNVKRIFRVPVTSMLERGRKGGKLKHERGRKMGIIADGVTDTESMSHYLSLNNQQVIITVKLEREDDSYCACQRC